MSYIKESPIFVLGSSEKSMNLKNFMEIQLRQ